MTALNQVANVLTDLWWEPWSMNPIKIYIDVCIEIKLTYFIFYQNEKLFQNFKIWIDRNEYL